MDDDRRIRLIEGRLDVLEGMSVSDDQSARDAFTRVLATGDSQGPLAAMADVRRQA
jgi:hypothetical protein